MCFVNVLLFCNFNFEEPFKKFSGNGGRFIASIITICILGKKMFLMFFCDHFVSCKAFLKIFKEISVHHCDPLPRKSWSYGGARKTIREENDVFWVNKMTNYQGCYWKFMKKSSENWTTSKLDIERIYIFTLRHVVLTWDKRRTTKEPDATR